MAEFRLGMIFSLCLYFTLTSAVFTVRQHECCSVTDIVFVLDGSESITRMNFIKTKDFVKREIERLNAMVNPGGVNMAVIVYSDEVSAVIPFSNSRSVSQLESDITAIEQPRLGTNTAVALLEAGELLWRKGRPGATKLVVLITDGDTRHPGPPRLAAEVLKGDNVSIICVGIGPDKNVAQLRALASKPEYVKEVANFTGLDKLKVLCHEVCPGTTTSSTVQPEPCVLNGNVIFIYDGSESISLQEELLMKVFVKDQIDELQLGTGRAGMGLVMFSNDATIEIELSNTIDADSLKNSVDNLRLPSKGSNIARGIEVMTDMFRRYGRPEENRTAVLITDGVSMDMDETVGIAEQARRDGIKMVAVGVGSEGQIDYDELNKIASSPDFVFNPRNFDELVFSDIASKLIDCTTTIVQPSTTLPPTTTPQPSTTSPPTTTPQPSTTPPPTTSPHPSTTPPPTTTPQPSTTPPPTTTPQPSTTPPPTTTPQPSTTPPPTTTAQPSTTPPPTTTLQPSTTPPPTTTLQPSTTPPPTTTPQPSITPPPTTTPTLGPSTTQTSSSTRLSPQPPSPSTPRPINVCKDCRIKFGAGFARHPDSCEKFIRCTVETLPNGQITAFGPVVFNCPTGLFWDQEDTLTCRYPYEVNCPLDNCRTNPGLQVYGDPTDCGVYWVCPNGYAMAKRCCPDNMAFDEGLGECVTDNNCLSAFCRPGTGGGVCHFTADPTDATVFIVVDNGVARRMPCPAGLAFVQATCGCHRRIPLPTQAAVHGCEPDVYLPFDEDIRDHSGWNRGVGNSGAEVEAVSGAIGGGAGKFDGKDAVWIYRYNNMEFPPYVEIRFRFRESAQSSGRTDPEALVTNGNCGDVPSLAISSVRPSREISYYTETQNGDAITQTSYMDGWTDVRYVYDRRALSGTSATSTQSTELAGIIRRTHSPIIIGHGQGFQNFTGYIDEFYVYFCQA